MSNGEEHFEARERQQYSEELLLGIYELGRMYLESGFFGPAERIFRGLTVVDNGKTPALIALGILKFQLGRFQEGGEHFRQALQHGGHSLESRLGLVVTALALKDWERARSLLTQLSREFRDDSSIQEDGLWESLVLWCQYGLNGQRP